MMLLDIKCFLDGQASGYHLKNKIFRTKPVGQDQNKLKENNSYNISFFFCCHAHLFDVYKPD